MDDLPISQIAWLLGYREVSAFTHAYKRWTGMTPESRERRETLDSPASRQSPGNARMMCDL